MGHAVPNARVEIAVRCALDRHNPELLLTKVPPPVAIAATGTDGSFRFTGVPTGEYGFIVRKAERVLHVSGDLVVADGTSLGSVELTCPAVPSITGVVFGPDGSPAPGRLVRVVVASRSPEDDEAPFAHEEVRSDSDGRFALSSGGNPCSIGVVADKGNTCWLAVYKSVAAEPHIHCRDEAWIDLTVRDGDGKPIPGARVVATDAPRISHGSVDMYSNDRFVATATSDGLGRCRLAQLPWQAPWSASVSADGFASHLDPGVASYTQARDWPRLMRGPNARSIVLARGATVTGVVTEGASKKPIPGARVRWVAADRRGPATRSDAQGRYTLRSVPTGEVVVAADKPGWVHSALDEPSVWTHDGSPPVAPGLVLANLQFARCDLTLTPLRRVDVEVCDLAGAPISGARITRWRESFERARPVLEKRLHWIADMGARALTDHAGRASVAVWAEPTDFLYIEASRFSSAWYHVPKPGASDGVLAVSLDRSATVTGVVSTADGLPLEGAEILVVKGSAEDATHLAEHAKAVRSLFRREAGVVRSLRDGSFRRSPAPSGEFVLVARHRDFVEAAVVSGKVSGRAEAKVEVKLGAGPVLEGVALADGTPAAGIRVVPLSELDPNDPLIAAGELEALPFAVTDAKGRFHARGLREGLEYSILNATPEFQQVRPVVAEPGSPTARLELRRLTIVAGVVRFADGRPAADVAVRVVPSARMPIDDRAEPVLTSADGKFRVILPVRSDCTVHAVTAPDRTGDAIESVRARVTEVGEQSLVLECRPGRRLDLRATLGGKPLSFASVRLSPRDSQASVREELRESRTDGAGRCQVTGLSSGPYRLRIDDSEDRSRTVTVRMETDVNSVVLAIDGGGAIKGRLVTPAGRRASGIIHLQGNDDTVTIGVEAGEFEVRQLMPGSYSVLLGSRDTKRTVVATAVVVEGETTDLPEPIVVR